MTLHLWQVVAQRRSTNGLAPRRTVMYACCSCGWVGHGHTTHGQAEAEARQHETEGS